MRSLACVVVTVSSTACSSFGVGTVTPSDAGVVGLDANAVGDASADGSTSLDAGTSLGCHASASALLFCDDFDGRTDVAGGKWNLQGNKGTALIDNALSFSPSGSLSLSYAAKTVDAGIGLETPLAISGTGVVVRAVVQTSQLISYVQLYSFVADSKFFAVIIDNGQLVAEYADKNAVRYMPTGQQLPLGHWAALAFEIKFGSNGSARLSLDGTQIYDDKAATTPKATVDAFELRIEPDFADHATAEVVTIHYDDVSVE